MSILSCVRPSVTPIDNARTLSGRFASPAAPSAIIEVMLPHGRHGYQVGRFGMIYATLDAAKSYAARRAGKAVAR